MATGQPTVVVYRTVKGWGYGIEGRASHGAGHKLCSDGFYQALAELSGRTSCSLPSCEGSGHRCEMGQDGPTVMEQCFYDALLLLRKAVEDDRVTAEAMAARLETESVKAAYRRRKAIVEPPNGWIKAVLGFRQFSFRGLAKVDAEWKLVCMALNLRRMAYLI